MLLDRSRGTDCKCSGNLVAMGSGLVDGGFGRYRRWALFSFLQRLPNTKTFGVGLGFCFSRIVREHVCLGREGSWVGNDVRGFMGSLDLDHRSGDAFT